MCHISVLVHWFSFAIYILLHSSCSFLVLLVFFIFRIVLHLLRRFLLLPPLLSTTITMTLGLTHPLIDDGHILELFLARFLSLFVRCKSLRCNTHGEGHGTRSETMAILVKELQGVTKRLRAFP